VTVPVTVGIDPGSRVTGYGVVEQRGRDILYIDSGVVRNRSSSSRPERLHRIKKVLDEVLRRHSPAALAVEQIFIVKNPKSIFVLGEVRGVVLLAAAEAGVPVYEYSPREVKSSVVGRGAATKGQVAAMIQRLLKVGHTPETEDETDALAVAFCHVLRDSGFTGGLR
jgi:crossover junction endodeoxyribonuclease RuvC